VLTLKIKNSGLLGSLLVIIRFLAPILDLYSKGKISKYTPFLFEKFLHLNLLTIILILGVVLILLYLYNKFISSKIKAQAILKKAEEFNNEYENYINFLSKIYEKRPNFSENEEMEYLSYHNKLGKLFLDIQFPFLDFLEEKYVVRRNRKLAYENLGDVDECFKSSNLKEHFLTKPEKPERIYYRKQIVEHFVSYLKSGII